MKRLLALLSVFALAACSGAGTGTLPGGFDRAGAGHQRTTADVQAQAADSPQALPGDSPQALPGDSPQALP
ncbi:MAG: hypothetical protein QOI11_282, partial [Candidatus Eremiobacteraeota bacterium]|nr:hypothetical protein [Candidatus Eremiobacteraeota bacterium]